MSNEEIGSDAGDEDQKSDSTEQKPGSSEGIVGGIGRAVPKLVQRALDTNTAAKFIDLLWGLLALTIVVVVLSGLCWLARTITQI